MTEQLELRHLRYVIGQPATTRQLGSVGWTSAANGSGQAERDLSNGGEWQSEPQLWSRYDGPIPEDGSREPELMGTIHVTYGTPTKYEITLYRVSITAAGVNAGWTVASLTDEALGFGGLTLAQCPRAIVNTPPKPFTY